MSSANPAPTAGDAPATAAPAAAVIAGAERRLAMLGRLAELGMQVAEALAAHAVAAPGDSQPKHDPGQSFARASRAVRLTLVLQAKLEQDLAALRAGEAAAAPAADPSPGWSLGDPLGSKERDYPSAHRNRVRENIWDVMNHEVSDPYRAQEILQDLHERLTEGERYDGVLYRPLRESVEAICKHLDLAPDWSRWTEDGFPPPGPENLGYNWDGGWRPDTDPKVQESRRQRRAEREAAAASRAAAMALAASKPVAGKPPDPYRRQQTTDPRVAPDRGRTLWGLAPAFAAWQGRMGERLRIVATSFRGPAVT